MSFKLGHFVLGSGWSGSTRMVAAVAWIASMAAATVWTVRAVSGNVGLFGADSVRNEASSRASVTA